MQHSNDIQGYLAICHNRVDAALERHLPPDTTTPTRLHAAMRYAALGAGKRIRPVLVYASGQALDVPTEHLDAPACAVELIHAYSLVHDDLPAMDDDNLRRGHPTCHRKFDEATAILAGDALQTLAFQVLCKDQRMDLPAETRLKMIETLAHASGSRGMAGGQALDIAATGQRLEIAELENMHIHKTGALIRASVKLGFLASGETSEGLGKHLDRYAKCIGLAFQVRDDILDVEGNTDTLGKTRGKDAAMEKPTYPALIGLEASREKADDLIQEAIDNLSDFGPQADPLRNIARYIIGRER